MSCSRCGGAGHNRQTCKGAPRAAPAPEAPAPAAKQRRCRACNVLGHRADTCPQRPTPRPSGIRLPLYHAPLRDRRPAKRGPDVFDHTERVTEREAITHTWRAPDGRTVVAVCPKRPLDCCSAEWAWEGLIVPRKVSGALDVRSFLPSATVTETGPAAPR